VKKKGDPSKNKLHATGLNLVDKAKCPHVLDTKGGVAGIDKNK